VSTNAAKTHGKTTPDLRNWEQLAAVKKMLQTGALLPMEVVRSRRFKPQIAQISPKSAFLDGFLFAVGGDLNNDEADPGYHQHRRPAAWPE
jgi:hypothetical protein